MASIAPSLRQWGQYIGATSIQQTSRQPHSMGIVSEQSRQFCVKYNQSLCRRTGPFLQALHYFVEISFESLRMMVAPKEEIRIPFFSVPGLQLIDLFTYKNVVFTLFPA